MHKTRSKARFRTVFNTPNEWYRTVYVFLMYSTSTSTKYHMETSGQVFACVYFIFGIIPKIEACLQGAVIT